MVDTLNIAYEEFDGYYDLIGFNVIGNEFTYYYDYADEVNSNLANVVRETFDSFSAEDWEMIREDIVKDSGIEDTITVAYEYYQPDGTLLVRYVKNI